MKKPVILLFGPTGMVGWYAFHYLSRRFEVIPVHRKDCDITTRTPETLRAFVELHRPQVILNCTNCYRGECSYEESLLVNASFPKWLDEVATAYGVPLVHLSTNGVFCGGVDAFAEDHTPDATDTYGKTKALGEKIGHSVLRFTVVGESERQGNESSLIEWLKRSQGTTVQGYAKEKWNGVTCLVLVEYLERVILANDYWKGVRHLCSSEVVTKEGLCRYINLVYHLNLTIEPVDTPGVSRLLSAQGPGSWISPEPILHQLYRQKVFTEIHRRPMGEYREKPTCRFCDTMVQDIFHIGDRVGLVGGFLEGPEEFEGDRVYPLTVSLCPNCKYIQCKQVVSSDELFRKNYYYYSSMIPSLVKHFEGFAEAIAERHPDRGTKIVEIGCNDGVLLHPLRQLGYTNLVGIDPSRTIQKIDPAIETHARYFDDEVTDLLLEKHGGFDVFVSCNSFAHIEDMKTILKNIRRLLKPSGVALIEVHSSKKIFQEKHFDFIYHEHMGYYTCTSLYHICRIYGMELERVENMPMHGGSLRCTIRMTPRAPGTGGPSPSVHAALEEERDMFEDPTFFQKYQQELSGWRDEFARMVVSLQAKSPVYGYGASGRSSTLVNYCGIHLDGMIDDADSKKGTFTPTFHVPIDGSEVLYGPNPPKYVVVLAWPYADFIMKTHQKYLDQGGTFIIPLPSIRVVSRVPLYNVVLISSAIVTSSAPLFYTPTRSHFTHEERFQQTLRTIDSIRRDVPNAYIVLVEGTELGAEMIPILQEKVDYLYEGWKEETLRDRVNGPHKGYAEASGLLSYLQSSHFSTIEPLISSISKISGRYWTRENFAWKVEDDGIICSIRYDNPHHPSRTHMSTMFYTVGRGAFGPFLQALEDCVNHPELGTGIALEHVFPLCMKAVGMRFYEKERMWVEGEYGPWGGYVCH